MRSAARRPRSTPTLPEVALLSAAMAEAMPGRGGIEGAPFWSESPFFVNRLGIPAVYCAPGDIRNCHTFEEHVEVEEYLAGIVGFASLHGPLLRRRRTESELQAKGRTTC